MIFEISMLVALLVFAVFKYGFPGCFSTRHTACNALHQIKQQNCVNTSSEYNSNTRVKGKTKRSKRSRQRKSESNGNEGSEKRRTTEENCESRTATTQKIKVKLESQRVTTRVSKTSLCASAAENQAECDAKARRRVLFSTKKAKDPFTFKLDQLGGVVETPYLRLLFLYKAVLKEIEITVTPEYKWKDERKEKLRMTPEVYFTSEDEMKFLRPVEVQLGTHYSSTKKEEPVTVEIERTEHCVPPNWLKIRDVEFHRGMIKFFMNQFCGIRGVCNSCERAIMSSRVSYTVSIRHSANVCNTERSFYLHVYTDTPDQREQVLQEMDQDGYRRIHPTQKYNVRHGCSLMLQLSSNGLHSTPQFAVVGMHDDIIMEAIVFKLQTLHGTLIPTSDLPIQAHLSEILSQKTTNMSYSAETEPGCPRNVNLTINGGSMIQANFNTGEVNQENLVPPVANQNWDTIPKVMTPYGRSQVVASNSAYSGTVGGTGMIEGTRSSLATPQVASSAVGACHVGLTSGSSTFPEGIQPVQRPSNIREMTTVPKALLSSLQAPNEYDRRQQAMLPESISAVATVPKSVSAGHSRSNSVHPPHQPAKSFQIFSEHQRAFTVTQVLETEPKQTWESANGSEDARFRQSTPCGFQSQPGFHSPSPIPTSGSFSTLKSLRSLSIPEAASHPAFPAPVSQSHPGYTQTVGRGDFFRRRNLYQRSAFNPPVRNSSHPSLVSLDFRPLTFDCNEAGDEEPNTEDQGPLFALPEEEQAVRVPCNPNTDYNNEVVEVLANALPHKKSASEKEPSEGTDVNPLPNEGISPLYQERPSAISSGFGSGWTTRNTSACADAFYEASESEEKSDPVATHHDKKTKATQFRDQLRPRSVSLSDPRKLAAKLSKVQEQKIKADHSTQTTLKMSYSDALKTPSSRKQQVPRASMLTRQPTRIPRPSGGKERRNGARSKKL